MGPINWFRLKWLQWRMEKLLIAAQCNKIQMGGFKEGSTTWKSLNAYGHSIMAGYKAKKFKMNVLTMGYDNAIKF